MLKSLLLGQGRLGRLSYGVMTLAIPILAVTVIWGALNIARTGALLLALVLFCVAIAPSIWVATAASVCRLRDAGWSVLLAALLPALAALPVVAFWFLPTYAEASGAISATGILVFWALLVSRRPVRDGSPGL